MPFRCVVPEPWHFYMLTHCHGLLAHQQHLAIIIATNDTCALPALTNQKAH